MGWISEIFQRQRGIGTSEEPEQPTPSEVLSSAAPRSQAKPSGRTGQDEPSRGPVDLRREIETAMPAGQRTEALRAALREIAGPEPRPRDRAFLEVLDSSLAGEGIPLPPMPQAVLAVQRIVDTPGCSLRALAREIQLDPALATKVVGIANSPFYAGMRPTRSVEDAVVRLGLTETRNITMAIALRSKVFRVHGFERDVQALWRHALATASASQHIAAAVGEDPDRGFLAGLTHDLGRVGLLALWAGLRPESRSSPRFAGSVLAKLHAPLGALLAGAWRLDPELSEAIAWHHEPDGAPEPHRVLAMVLQAGDALAKHLAPDPRGERGDSHWEESLVRLGVPADGTGEIEAESREAFEALAKVV